MHAIILSDCPMRNVPIAYRYLGSYKVAHSARKRGFDVQVIDFVTRWTEEQLDTLIRKFITPETRIIGISITFIGQHLWENDTRTASYNENVMNQGSWNNKERLPPHVKSVLQRIKKEFPSITFILGGYLSDCVDGWGIIDAAVTGYAEDIFPELLAHLVNGEKAPKSILKIPHWGSKAMRIYSEPNEITYNIHEDNHRFVKEDCIQPGETLPIEVSRGCMFKCKFCQFQLLGRGKLDYLRDFALLKDELEYNYQTFGTQNYYIICDTFNDTEYKVKSFYEMTQSLSFKINFASYLRADLIHRFPDTAFMLQESGCKGAFFGIETLHSKAALDIGKAWSGKHAREFMPELNHNIWKGKIGSHINMIVGLPHDTEIDVRESVDWWIQTNIPSVRYDALFMKKNQWFNLSEYEKNATKYGFTWAEDDTWVNNEWTEHSATKLATEIEDIFRYRIKQLPWMTVNLLGMGHSDDSVMNNTRYGFDWSSQHLKLNELMVNYYTQLMAI